MINTPPGGEAGYLVTESSTVFLVAPVVAVNVTDFVAGSRFGVTENTYPRRPTVQNDTGVTNSGCPRVTIQVGTENSKKPPCKQGGFLFAS